MNSNVLLSNLGSNIRKYRKTKGYTIDHLAEMSSLSGKYLQGVEVGNRNISVKNLNKIAQSLEVLADDLLSINTKLVQSESDKILSISEKLKNFESNKLDFIGEMLDSLGVVITEQNKGIEDKINKPKMMSKSKKTNN